MFRADAVPPGSVWVGSGRFWSVQFCQISILSRSMPCFMLPFSNFDREEESFIDGVQAVSAEVLESTRWTMERWWSGGLDRIKCVLRREYDREPFCPSFCFVLLVCLARRARMYTKNEALR